MKRALPLGLALTAGIAMAARAQTTEPRDWTKGTPVVIVGVVSSQPRDVKFTHEKKMQVAIGPNKTDYTLHMNDARMFGYHGGKMSADDFKDKMWVRAHGFVMDDPRRIDVTQVQVIGGNLQGVKQTSFYRPGFDHGYVMTTNQPVGKEYLRESTGAATNSGTSRSWSQGTPVVVVGTVSSPPKGALNEKKMQVAIGPSRTDYTLHFADATLIGPYGQKIDEDGLDDRMWVRAEGTVMDDPKRIRVSRLQVIGNADSFQRSAFWRPGLAQGYVSSVAGSREIFPVVESSRFVAGPMTLVGRVTDDTDPARTSRKIQVSAAGNEWTLNVDDNAAVIDGKGEKISVHEVDQGQWIRATGWQTDDLRMRVVRLENVGADEAYRGSSFFRTGEPLGYIERTAGERSQFQPVSVRGTITAINRDAGYVTIRDEQGNSHRVYTDAADVRLGGFSSGVNDLVIGDRVTVSGRTVRF